MLSGAAAFGVGEAAVGTFQLQQPIVIQSPPATLRTRRAAAKRGGFDAGWLVQAKQDSFEGGKGCIVSHQHP